MATTLQQWLIAARERERRSRQYTSRPLKKPVPFDPAALIHEIGLSARVTNHLDKLGIKTVGELLNTYPSSLLTSDHFGPAMLHEVRQTCLRWLAGKRPKDPRTPKPTTAPPGSEEKILVMEARVAAGQSIFHPADDRRGEEA